MKNNTFESARIKLTLWYLVIIMLVSIIFSFAIYQVVSGQIEGFIRMQNNRIEQFQWQPPTTSLGQKPPKEPPLIDTQELINQERQLFYWLIFINLAIFGLSGTGGYFLAGRTLTPIKLMMEDQSQFISNSSHELRTPIAILRAEMEASLLEKHLSDQTARTLINSNLEELSTLQKLTDNLLEISKIRNGTLGGQLTQILVSDLAKSAEKKVLPLAKKKRIGIKNMTKEGVINGVNDKLVEVLIILLDNAIKYSPADSQIILSSVVKNNRVIISVTDQGSGISPDDIPHIFERFYRADKSRSLADGFGLGLSIAKKIVEAHKGTITVESALGKGTIFKLSFPQNYS